MHRSLAQLAHDNGKIAMLTNPSGYHMVELAQVQTMQHIPVLTPVETQVPMYASSCGCAYLSQLSDAQAVRCSRPRRARSTRAPPLPAWNM